jgi:hypothetical protein
VLNIHTATRCYHVYSAADRRLLLAAAVASMQLCLLKVQTTQATACSCHGTSQLLLPCKPVTVPADYLLLLQNLLIILQVCSYCVSHSSTSPSATVMPFSCGLSLM